ncbi:hypothetical protein EVAR_84436_1 [Eumeta japonica]|uniref:Uncharacterized protein n=1 Tax=Eumeta variegata TaxID=151549 RepID=A0A4C1W4B0_EUMVA|nr:hypothetical protein EVAR_84436_1 [Eumeta japonica]
MLERNKSMTRNNDKLNGWRMYEVMKKRNQSPLIINLRLAKQTGYTTLNYSYKKIISDDVSKNQLRRGASAGRVNIGIVVRARAAVTVIDSRRRPARIPNVAGGGVRSSIKVCKPKMSEFDISALTRR